MARWSDAEPVLEAAEQWRDRCLLGEGSILTTKNLWTAESVAYLDRYFVQNLDYGEGDFFQKLRAQLGPAPPEAKQLAAEMLWALYIYVMTAAMRAGTKRHQIKQVWEWSGEPLPDAPSMLGEVLEHGVGHPGTAYNTHRWRELLFLIVLLGDWYRLPVADRSELLADPWRFIEWVDRIEESAGRQFRHILAFLLFPDSFERMATGYQKRRIVRRFREELGEDPDEPDYGDRSLLDREILRIRRIYEERLPDRKLDFYEAPLREVWWEEDDDEVDEPEKKRGKEELETWYRERFDDRRVWLVGAGIGGRAWDEFRREGLVAIGWDYLGDLGEYAGKGEILEALSKQPDMGDNPSMSALACWQFAHEIQAGDFVLAKRGLRELLGWGVITSDYEFDPTRGEYQHVRRVEWRGIGPWHVPAERSFASKTLTEFTDYKNWLRDAFELIEGRAVEDHDAAPAELRERERVPYGLQEALDDLFISEEEFRAVLDALGRKKSVILEGPPGVGKSFIAKRVAWRFIGYRDPDRVQMIQFHQSYTYEDFIQGWRPAPGGGFELRDGVFYTFCRSAQDDLENPYVFIVDEINRGNLSKIFGEVMLLLEADKRGPEFAVPLAYSGDGDPPFHIPRNVHVLGLMNTADRSLAMVDYALRRRFAFVRLTPAFGSERFADYLLAAGVEEDLLGRIVERFSDLNRRIREDVKNLGPGFEIGHSFFCPQEGDESLDSSWYETVVRSEIEPLLNEYWFDDPPEAKRLVERLLA